MWGGGGEGIGPGREARAAGSRRSGPPARAAPAGRVGRRIRVGRCNLFREPVGLSEREVRSPGAPQWTALKFSL